MNNKKAYYVYPIGEKVFAISTYTPNGKDCGHYAIIPAIVKSVTISINKSNEEEIDYWLSTPSGAEWGDVVLSTEVSTSFEELIQLVKKRWEQLEMYK